MEESSLLAWINLHYEISQLEEFRRVQTLILFLQQLFQISLKSDTIPDVLKELKDELPIPMNTDITEDDLIRLLEYIQQQYQAYTIKKHLSNKELTFSEYTQSFTPQHVNDIKNVFLSWLNGVLSDYIQFIQQEWSSGFYLLCCIHYHHPSLVPNLHEYISLDDVSLFNTATQLLYTTFNIPSIIIDHTSELNILSYYIELCLPIFTIPSHESINQRHQDIERFKSILNQKKTTTTATYSYQQLRITKTTKYTSQHDDIIPSPELDTLDQHINSVTEKMNSLQHRLMLIIPTRSCHNYSPISNSITSESVEFFLTDDNTSTTRSTSSIIHSDNEIIRLLHPLQAAEEDYSAYDRNFKSLQAEFQTLSDGDYHLLQLAFDQLDPQWHTHPFVVQRKTQLHQHYTSLAQEFEKSDSTLAHFRRGFAFARMCNSIRQELDFVQNKMVKSITSFHDIHELELAMDKTTDMVNTLKFNFSDLLNQQPPNPSCEDSTDLVCTALERYDPAYLQKYQSVESKNQLVKTWVDEVRVWFTEAERIRQWIEIRVEQIKGTTLPDPLSTINISRDQVEALNASHSLLEKEIEAFDKEDMARLRSHVKSLTGANKDLSPADTTTIEITLTTLMSLDKLMHMLRRKSYDLQVLTQRVIWEEELENATAWLQGTEQELDDFLSNDARWTPSEEEEDENRESTPARKRERLMAREKQKETVIQQLLTLERKVSEFDQGQFNKTVDSFQDLDNTSTTELPDHLESRQKACEQQFEDLMKRMAFARHVVEQRLNVMDFLYQAELVADDTAMLALDIKDAESKAHPGDNDREMTARVQSMHERTIQLVTATASRIPYPSNALDIDKESNAEANEKINQVINEKRNQLLLLSDELDQRLNAFRNILQLHRKAKEHLDDATRLCDWANERIQAVKKAKLSIQQDLVTIDDLQRLERDCQTMISKLKNGKENEVVDLLTRIPSLLETSQKLNITSIDSDSLTEVSQQLEETFDRLQQVLDEHVLELEALRKKLEEGNTYFETARSLKTFMSETRLSLPALKQTCGFMTGQSEEQDRQRLNMLQHTLATIEHDYNSRQTQFDQLCSHFKHMRPSKQEDAEETRKIQDSIEHEWNALGKDIQDLKQFTETVGQWYERQRRLSIVNDTFLDILHDEISRLTQSDKNNAELDAVQQRIDQATEMLNEIGTSIDEAQDSEKQDPLQIANYSCAKDRYNLLVSKLQAAKANMAALRSDAHTSLAFQSFLKDANKLMDTIQLQKEQVNRRMTEVGQARFRESAESVNTLESLANNILQSVRAAESDYAGPLQAQVKSLLEKIKQFEPNSAERQTAQETLRSIHENMNQLKDVIASERKQAVFIQKVQTHAKGARDLQGWIDQCSSAIAQLPTDVCIADEQDLLFDLEHYQQKIIQFEPTIQAFQAMPSKIWKHVNGDPVDLCAISLDRDQVKDVIDQREAKILKAWQDLKDQHAKARSSVDFSKRGVEAARKVKAVLMQIGDLKERVSAVRICKPKENEQDSDDLQNVLQCSLTDIPTEHRLASAKAELGILERDIEAQLLPAIKQLDLMLNAAFNNSQDDMFSDQRQEISSAVRGLLDLVKCKRRAINEAERMQEFLTVMEEVEVLLLALAEVVARASPGNARMNEDGTYLRTDLQALLIDLDTRYGYYEPKIIELMDELRDVSEHLLGDRRVAGCIKQFTNKWTQLQSEAAARKQELTSLIGPLTDSNFDFIKATEGMLLARGRRAAAASGTLTKRSSAPILAPQPKPTQTMPRYMTGLNRKPTRASNNNGSVSPTARRVAARQTAAQQQRVRATNKTPEAYVADPKNDLDVAVGNIVNDSPYKIKIKMVPGEVGKYWFGEVNPKLAYCRILRSRMVMVRVGGGWVELSQFLRDHALLESGTFVTSDKTAHRASLPPPASPREGVQEGFLNTVVGRNTPVANNRRSLHGVVGVHNNIIALRGQAGGPPQLKESRSTPYYRGMSPIPTTYGIKSGNKFVVTVDDKGNQVEVKMTKAKNHDAKFVTPRRINI
ncbi:hypothetical protein BCV72DRAFT_308564 [Rhizopus microsporus var. microsporus]|uniref:GAR domain-containing protein n=1 Tax=Rhizopus microsporus var. microsporus TaxID=86635 RepID=A0A1X0QTL1_RHIZD|nr:hypothetical protein BCV72DRAFT_308564 [Rhizopus microsporus var. microsporus]